MKCGSPTADQEAPAGLPRAEFESLALAEFENLFRMARRLTRETTRAEDLVQETFARALANSAGFDLFGFGIKPWLMRILYNLHLNRLARDRRHPAMVLDLAHFPDDNGCADRCLPIAPHSSDAMHQEVVRALEHLAPEYRTIVMLWAIEELSYKEISAVLAIPIGTVMSRLHRARCKLAAELHHFAAREGVFRA